MVQHLRAQGGVSSIGLWGRSMGAVTALLYSHLDPDIAGMVSCCAAEGACCAQTITWYIGQTWTGHL